MLFDDQLELPEEALPETEAFALPEGELMSDVLPVVPVELLLISEELLEVFAVPELSLLVEVPVVVEDVASEVPVASTELTPAEPVAPAAEASVASIPIPDVPAFVSLTPLDEEPLVSFNSVEELAVP